MSYRRSVLFLIAALALAIVAPCQGNIQNIPTTWIYVSASSSFDAMTRDIPGGLTPPFFGQLNGQRGFNPAHLGARFNLPYVDRVNAFGDYAWDLMLGYSNNAALSGLNFGFGVWPNISPTNTPYVSRNNAFPAILFDSMTNYVNAAPLAGSDDCYLCTNANQNMIAWGGPYVEGNFPVDIGTGIGTTNSQPVINFNGNYVNFCTTSVYYTTDGSTPTTNSATVFMSPGCGGGTLLGVPDPSFNLKLFAFGPLLHGPVTTVTFCSLGTCWSNQVVLNGGSAPALASVTNVNNFWQGLLSDWGANPPTVYSLNLMATDSLTAAITPQIWSNRPSPGTGAQFGGIWTNHNFVAGDLTLNGLTGNGSSKYLDTGFTPLSVAGDNSAALALYCYNNINETKIDFAVQWNSGTQDFELYCPRGTSGFGAIWNEVNGLVTGTTPNLFQGFLLTSRTSGSLNTYYIANSGTAWQSAGTQTASTSIGSRTSGTLNLYLMCANVVGTPNFFSSKTYSFAGVFDGLDSSHGQALYNRVQTWRQANQGGFR